MEVGDLVNELRGGSNSGSSERCVLCLHELAYEGKVRGEEES